VRRNQAGSVFIVVAVLLVLLSIVGLIGWRIHDSRTPTETPEKPASCGHNGIIIVQFGASSKEQQRAIIAEEHASIHQEYTSLPGLYAVKVSKGKEQLSIDSFKRHPEVQTANRNGCNSTSSMHQ
jgi:hypothetical protein